MPKITLSFFRSYLSILLFTAFEVAALRLILHSVLRLEIGWVGMTDFDIAIPMMVSLFISLLVLSQTGELKLKIQKPILYCNIALIASFLILSSMLPQIGVSPLIHGIWVFLLLAVFLSSLCVWVAPSFYVSNSNNWVVFPALMLAISVVVYQHYYEVMWPSLIPLTGKASCAVLKPILGGALKCSMNSSMDMLLREKYFWADIGAGCSGMEGQLFFIISFLILLSLYGKKVGIIEWSIFLISGPIVIFWANILRIVVFFLIGAISVRTSYFNFGRTTMLFLFHSHAGWVLYSSAILCLQSLVLVPSVKKKISQAAVAHVK